MRYTKLDTKSIIKFINLLLLIFFINLTSLEADEKKDKDEKDCLYCKKFETLQEWPESERPEAFIYEEIKYPEKMFHESMTTSKLRQKEAGRMVYKRFVKGKSSLNKYMRSKKKSS